MSAAERQIAAASAALSRARTGLDAAVREACPGRHVPTQHRDGKPAWCPACGRTANGVTITEPRP